MCTERNLSAREQWLVKRIRGNLILDVGFAGQKGQLPAYYSVLSQRSCGKGSIIGVDLNAQAVFALQQPRSIVGNAGKLPIIDESIDCVVMAEFIEHHVDIQNFLTESWRVLRRGGIFLLTTPNPGFLNRWLCRWFGRTPDQMLSKHNLKRAMGHDDHQVLWDPLSLCTVLCSSDFQ